ncbi:hypothetical protein Pla22_37050 [Rubripirellula amarantea]|uniref:Uncharacterized protein n=1 Tax=Rubripirellula amarantea TaxID=2527999 RepID=A0A5C5WMD9_9BACT|nr:hypothetical protein [Rubripirellula amarantea]TWT50962.1 hypothetical protein Pla22_37050 [Rubripirellula amarantea]
MRALLPITLVSIFVFASLVNADDPLPPWDVTPSASASDQKNGSVIIKRYSFVTGFTSNGRREQIPASAIWWWGEPQPNSDALAESGTISFRDDDVLDRPIGEFKKSAKSVTATLPASYRESVLHCLQSGTPVQIQFRTADATEKSKLILLFMSIRSPSPNDVVPKLKDLPYPF